jgi:hypothetical protein
VTPALRLPPRTQRPREAVRFPPSRVALRRTRKPDTTKPTIESVSGWPRTGARSGAQAI